MYSVLAQRRFARRPMRFIHHDQGLIPRSLAFMIYIALLIWPILSLASRVAKIVPNLSISIARRDQLAMLLSGIMSLGWAAIGNSVPYIKVKRNNARGRRRVPHMQT